MLLNSGIQLDKGDIVLVNSITELCNVINGKPFKFNRKASEKDRGGDWCDTDTYEQALEELKYGTNRMDSVINEVKKYDTIGSGTKRKRELGVVGYNVNVPLYLQGVPTCMESAKKQVCNDIVNIVYNCGANCNVTSDDLKRGAIDLMKSIIDMERNHKRVNLYLVQCTEGYPYNKTGQRLAVFGMKLKRDREPLNVRKLVFPLCSSSFFRRIYFRINETLFESDFGDGYGCSYHNNDGICEVVKNIFNVDSFELWNYKGKQGMFKKGNKVLTK